MDGPTIRGIIKASFDWVCFCGEKVKSGEEHDCTWAASVMPIAGVVSKPAEEQPVARPRLRLIEGGKK